MLLASILLMVAGSLANDAVHPNLSPSASPRNFGHELPCTRRVAQIAIPSLHRLTSKSHMVRFRRFAASQFILASQFVLKSYGFRWRYTPRAALVVVWSIIVPGIETYIRWMEYSRNSTRCPSFFRPSQAFAREVFP